MERTRALSTLNEIARDAVEYTFPLYEMARMRAAVAARRTDAGVYASDSPESTLRWVNCWGHTRQLLGPASRRVVTPNNDTLYSTAWLDLSRGPVLLDVPDTAGRYYVLGLIDFHTNPFEHIGSRTTGTAAATFLLHGPGWQGAVPAGVRAICCPTPAVWIIGRLLVDGPDDVADVVALQDQLRIRALDPDLPVPTRIDAGMRPDERAGDASRYLDVVNRALAENPPPPEQAALVAGFAPCGIGPGLPAAAATPSQLEVLGRVIRDTLAELARPQPSALGGGWFLPAEVSQSFGTRLRERAQVALNYIGVLGMEEAMYVIAERGADDQPLDGRRPYLLHFPAGGLPQVDAFWSLTAYDKASCLLVDNEIDRYSIGDRTPGLRHDDDGGLRIALSAQPPSDPVLRANWLPVPAGPFYVAMRLYMPRADHLQRRFRYPAIEVGE